MPSPGFYNTDIVFTCSCTYTILATEFFRCSKRELLVRDILYIRPENLYLKHSIKKGSCVLKLYPIKSLQQLFQELDEIGDWEGLCGNLEVDRGGH